MVHEAIHELCVHFVVFAYLREYCIDLIVRGNRVEVKKGNRRMYRVIDETPINLPDCACFCFHVKSLYVLPSESYECCMLYHRWFIHETAIEITDNVLVSVVSVPSLMLSLYR